MPMFAAYHLYRAPFYSQARAPRGNPVVIVPNESEVAIARRVMQRASVHKALAIVDFRCAPGLYYCRLVRRQGIDDHNFVMPRAKWLKEVSSLIGHSSEILYFHLKSCI